MELPRKRIRKKLQQGKNRKNQKTEKLTVVLDCHGTCHALKHTLKGLSHEEQKTGILFGFLRHVIMLQELFESTAMVFTWDSKYSKRKEMFTGYKDRAPVELSDEDKALNKLAYPQFTQLRRKIIPSLGFFNSFIQSRYEADDVMASIVANNNNRIILITRDHDMYQLLNDKCTIYDPVGKIMHTAATFEKQYGITPNQWGTVKSIAGCKTDTVPGIERVGESTAIKYLNGTLGPKTKAYQAIQQGKAIIRRNRKLVVLPLKGTKIFEVKHGFNFDSDAFHCICQKLGFTSFLKTKQFNRWLELFS